MCCDRSQKRSIQSSRNSSGNEVSGEFWWRKGWNSKCISRGPFDGKTVISFFFSRKEMPKIGSDRECNERSLEINVLLSFLFFSLSSSSSILVSRSAKNEIWSVYKVIDIVYRYAIDIKDGKVLKNRFCKKMKSTLIKTTKRVRVRQLNKYVRHFDYLGLVDKCVCVCVYWDLIPYRNSGTYFSLFFSLIYNICNSKRYKDTIVCVH